MSLEEELLGADLLEHNVRHDILYDQRLLAMRESNIKIATIYKEGQILTGNGHVGNKEVSHDPLGDASGVNNQCTTTTTAREDKHPSDTIDVEKSSPKEDSIPEDADAKKSSWFYQP